MPFHIISERESPQIRYEKVGRLVAGEDGMIRVIRDGHGILQIIPTGDIILTLQGLPVPGLELSESGNRILISGKYFVLVRQVRGMIQDWPRKKAALFVREEE